MDSNKKPNQKEHSTRFREYGRNQTKRKEYIDQPGILYIRADISKAK